MKFRVSVANEFTLDYAENSYSLYLWLFTVFQSFPGMNIIYGILYGHILFVFERSTNLDFQMYKGLINF